MVIPRGIWLTGPVTLQNNVRIHTEEGAVVQFSDDMDDYPLVKTSFEGLETYRCISPINGQNLENIAFTGKGVFDGDGLSFQNIDLRQKEGPGITFYNTQNATVKKVEFAEGQATWVRVLGKLSADIELAVDGINASRLAFGQGAKKEAAVLK